MEEHSDGRTAAAETSETDCQHAPLNITILPMKWATPTQSTCQDGWRARRMVRRDLLCFSHMFDRSELRICEAKASQLQQPCRLAVLKPWVAAFEGYDAGHRFIIRR